MNYLDYFPPKYLLSLERARTGKTWFVSGLLRQAIALAMVLIKRLDETMKERDGLRDKVAELQTRLESRDVVRLTEQLGELERTHRELEQKELRQRQTLTSLRNVLDRKQLQLTEALEQLERIKEVLS